MFSVKLSENMNAASFKKLQKVSCNCELTQRGYCLIFPRKSFEFSKGSCNRKGLLDPKESFL